MRRIFVGCGRFAVVDDVDYAAVKDFNWSLLRNPSHRGLCYARAVFWHGGKQVCVLMHRLLAGFPPFKLDHKNRNGLDNRRKNLRPATNSQNGGNQIRSCNNMSGSKGVGFRSGRWRARICKKRRPIFLGWFDSREKAAAAYAKAARRLFGEYARV